jgi:hypothetical protein
MVGSKEKVAKESGCLVMNDKSISLTDLPRRLREITGGTVPVPTYRVLYARVLDGTLPAERRNGRWHVTESAVRDLAQHVVGEQSGK